MNTDARQHIADEEIRAADAVATEAHAAAAEEHRPVFEEVESRSMMSATPSVELDGHVLTIEGTAAADRIEISITDDGSQMWANVDGHKTEAMAARSVYEIKVDAGEGDNHVYIDPRITANATVVTGGGRDVVYTGSGNDNITTGGGRDIVDSGAGNDTVDAGSGNDKINAGSGNDKVNAGGGNDSLSADGGTDKLVGKAGNDKFYADADDIVDTGSGKNQVSRSASLKIRNDGFVAPKIKSITVVDADTGEAVDGYENLTADTTLDPSKLPARYTIVAQAEDGVRSVYFQTSDNSLFRKDNGKAFSMTAQDASGKYKAWSPTMGKTYTLSVVPNTAANTSGFEGEHFTIKLTLKGGSTSTGGSNTGGTTTGGTTNGGGKGGTTTGADYDAAAPRIKMTKLSETTLAGQQFSIEATGTTVPGYGVEDAKFEWNFGDPTGAHNVLPGFNAAHVYDKAGSYTVTLTVTAPGGHVSTATTTVNVTASNYGYVYVAANGNDKNDGSSQGQAVKTLVRAAQLVDDNTKVLLRRGDTFGTTTEFHITNDNVVIGSYGNASAARPVVRYEGALKPFMMFDVEASATNVTFAGLTFDSIYDNDTSNVDMPHGIHASGTLITVRDNQFLNIGCGVNNNGNPNGEYVVDNVAPSVTGLRTYFVWAQGKNLAIVGNTIANSTREHNIRVSSATNVMIAYNDLTNADRRPDGDGLDYSKGTITNQKSSYSYIADNELHGGALGVGPLGGKAGSGDKSARTNHVVVEGNEIYGNQIFVYHGALDTTIRDNEIHRDGQVAIWSEGYNSDYGRGVVDLWVDHNVAFNDGAGGEFFWLGGAANGVQLTDNVYVAPNLAPGDGAGGVKVSENGLGSFTRIDGNIWPSAERGNEFAEGGLFAIGTTGAGDYETLAIWNARSQVGNDVSTDVSAGNAWKLTTSALKQAA